MEQYYNLFTKAKVERYSAVLSGISNPWKSGVRPNHFFGTETEFNSSRNFHIGEITFGDELFYPNEIKIVSVRFLWSDKTKDIEVGTKWFICTPGKIIGEGEILEIIGKKVLANSN